MELPAWQRTPTVQWSAINFSPAVAEQISLHLPVEMRPRGWRGRTWVRNTQRHYKPVLPSVIMGNMQTLSWQHWQNTIDFSVKRVYYVHGRIGQIYCEQTGLDLEMAKKKMRWRMCPYVTSQWCRGLPPQGCLVPLVLLSSMYCWSMESPPLPNEWVYGL